jgi:hypothetical protein
MSNVRVRMTRGIGLKDLTQQQFVERIRDAVRASGMPAAHGAKGDRRPRIAAGPTLPNGFTSRAEYFDIALAPERPPVSDAELFQSLARALPGDCELLWLRRLPPRTPHLRASVRAAWYGVRGDFAPECVERFRRCLHEGAPWLLRTERKGQERAYDLKDCIGSLFLREERRADGSAESQVLYFSILARQDGTPKPREVVGAIFPEAARPVEQVPMERAALELATPPWPRKRLMESE